MRTLGVLAEWQSA